MVFSIHSNVGTVARNITNQEAHHQEQMDVGDQKLSIGEKPLKWFSIAGTADPQPKGWGE